MTSTDNTTGITYFHCPLESSGKLDYKWSGNNVMIMCNVLMFMCPREEMKGGQEGEGQQRQPQLLLQAHTAR